MKLQGLRRDERPTNGAENSWGKAKNILLSKGWNSITNEEGFQIHQDGLKLITGIIPANKREVVFSIDNNVVSEIGIKEEDGTYNIILRDIDDLNFQKDRPIEGVFRINDKGHLLVAWCDGIEHNSNPVRILNLDCLPFEIDPVTYFPIDSNDIELLRLFPKGLVPKFNLLSVNDSGGGLLSGVHYISVAYELFDGSTTNYLTTSAPISITDDLKFEGFNEYDGIEAGSPTSKSISMNLSNVDTRYSKVVVALVSKIGGITTAKEIGRYNISIDSFSIEVTGQESSTDITVDEILVPKTSYEKVKAITSLKEQLIIADLTRDSLPNYQPYANNIQVEWVREERVSIDSVLNSYKDETIIYLDKSFRMDEVYALYIGFKMKDGTYSDGFHIPGREALTGDTDVLDQGTYPEDYSISPENVKKFHTQETGLDDGTMGYWENADEYYPDTDCSDIYDASGNIVGTLRNQNVRHHKFPSMSSFADWDTFVESNLGDSSGVIGTFSLSDPIVDSISPIGVDFMTFDSITNTTGSPITEGFAFNYFHTYYTANENQSVEVVSDLDFDFTSAGAGKLTYQIVLVKNIHQVKQVLQQFTFDFAATPTFSIDEITNITVLKDEAIRVTISITDGVTPDSVSGDISGTAQYLEGNGTIFSKKLGIKISNVNIPAEIANKIDSWEIFYAKRTLNNSTVIGQSLILPQGWNTTNTVSGSFRFHSFDMLNFKPTSIISHFKGEVLVSGADNNYVQTAEVDSIYTTNPLLRKVDNSQYVPNNISTPIVNLNKEEYFYGEIGTDIVLSSEEFLLGNMCVFRRNVYNSFDSQELVSTGIRVDPSIDEIEVLYGGDTFINSYGVRLTFDVSTKAIFYFICESASNIGFRHEGDTSDEIYFPKSSSAALLGLASTETNYFAYNEDYSTLNDLNIVFPKKCLSPCNEEISEFPHRVARSIEYGDESVINNWRVFLVNDYKEMPRDKGRIWKLSTLNRSLLIQHEFALFIASIKDKLNSEIYVGEGNIFDREPDELLADDEGYVGCRSQFSAFTFKGGYFVIDREQGKIFIYNGKLDEISAKGMRNWFRDNLEHEEFIDIDNPFTEVGISASFDEKYDRIIFCKKDYIPGDTYQGEYNNEAPPFTYTTGDLVYMEDSFGKKEFFALQVDGNGEVVNLQGSQVEITNETYFDNVSFTYSYDIVRQIWICEHDYFPSYIYRLRTKLLSVRNYKNNTYTGQIYEHNIESLKATFYDGTVYSSFVDILFNQPMRLSKVYPSFSWITEIVAANGVVSNNETITHIMIYNSKMCTGIIEIKSSEVYFKKNVQNSEDTWNFNDVRDTVIDGSLPFIDSNKELILSNLNPNKTWFNKNKFISKFAIVRFIYDNSSQKDFYLHDVMANVRKSDR